MKPIIAWIKKNWIITTCVAVIVVSLPVSWVFASGMNAKLRTTREKEVNDKLKAVSGAGKVSYSVPVPGAPKGWEYTGAPNVLVTEAFKKFKERVDAQTTDILKTAEDFNRGVGPLALAVGRVEHKPLMNGIFPGPAAKEALERLCFDFEDTLAAKRGRPNPYQVLLDGIRAGGPPDPVAIKTRLDQDRLTAIERKKTGNRDLTPAEREQVEAEMTGKRLDYYQSQAAQISVYATLKSLPVESSGTRGIFTEQYLKQNAERLADAHVAHREMWLFQWDYWVISDILSAVRVANTRDGKVSQVPESIVKRIDSITLDFPKLLAPVDDPMGLGATAAATGGGTMLDPNVSITGRTSSSANTEYDVRDVTLVAIVSSARLQDFLSAISRTNFMTVIDMDLAHVDPYVDLSQGYWYGEESVVRATVKIETIWLRGWLNPLTPRPIRDQLGIKLPGDEPAPEGAGTAATTPATAAPPPKAPAPAPPRPGLPPKGPGRPGGG